jgi:AcrR family transcriptional regulator
MLDPYTERILAAARRLLLEFGLKRTSLADVAREAEVSEATLYRRFAGRDELLQTLFARETRAFIAQLDAADDPHADPVDRIVAAWVTFVHATTRQELAYRLIRTDPDVAMPMLTTGCGPSLAFGRDYISSRLVASGLPLNGDAVQLAELLVRIAHSLFLTPESSLPLDDDAAMAAFARTSLVRLVIAPEWAIA